MLDINLVRENPDLVRKSLQDRQMDPGVVDQVIALDEKRRGLILEVENLKADRNAASKEIGRMKDPLERQAKIDAMREVGDRLPRWTRPCAAWSRSWTPCGRGCPISPTQPHPTGWVRTITW
jgi:seryl-tRNA synthetase